MGNLRFPVNAKIEKISLEKKNMLVQYLDKKEVLVVDENYEDKRIDLIHLEEYASLLERRRLFIQLEPNYQFTCIRVMF